jgi:replicative DNA helicase Mcm
MIEALYDEWTNFLRQYYKTQMDEILLTYPLKKSLLVDYWDVDRYSEDLAEALLFSPKESFVEAQKALDTFMEGKDVTIRVKNLTKTYRIRITELRSGNLNRLVAIEGLVKKVTEVRPILKVGVYRCSNCGEEVYIEQDTGHLQEPVICQSCGKRAKFSLVVEKSLFSDTQKIEIQEMGEGVSSEPARLSAYAEGDIAGVLNPGDHIIANGILRGSVRLDEKRAKTTVFDKYLEANSFELQEEKLEEIEITDEDERRIIEISKSDDLISDIIASISPTIYGLDMEKKALALQLFGGLQKEMEDGTRIRGDIHVLFVGDPGTAKSQLLRYVAQIAPRGMYTSGKGSSAAGLTATVVKDAFGEGRWTLEAGVLVLADRGVACIDEIDKMTPQDASAMHQAMEQQEVSIAKAGISATLQTRCSILGAANPQYGRFDPYKPTGEQINLSPALLSRFDLIFPFTDTPDKDRDRKLAEHIAKVHFSGELKELRKRRRDVIVREYIEGSEDVAKPAIEPTLLKKYVAYAKMRIVPVLTPAAMDRLVSYYAALRRSGEGGAIPVTARQFEAMIRLAEASARMRLSNFIEEKDCETATGIMDYCLKKIGTDAETGRLDIDTVIGKPASQRNRMSRVMEIVRELEVTDDRGAEEGEIIRMAVSEGIPEAQVTDTLRKLKAEGMIYEPKAGRFRSIKNR